MADRRNIQPPLYNSKRLKEKPLPKDDKENRRPKRSADSPARVQPKILPARVQPKISPARVQPKISPARVQPGIPPTRFQSKILPTRVQPKIPPTLVRRNSIGIQASGRASAWVITEESCTQSFRSESVGQNPHTQNESPGQTDRTISPQRASNEQENLSVLNNPRNDELSLSNAANDDEKPEELRVIDNDIRNEAEISEVLQGEVTVQFGENCEMTFDALNFPRPQSVTNVVLVKRLDDDISENKSYNETVSFFLYSFSCIT